MDDRAKMAMADRFADAVDDALARHGLDARVSGGFIDPDAIHARLDGSLTDAQMMDVAYDISRAMGRVKVTIAEDSDGKFYSVKVSQ